MACEKVGIKLLLSAALTALILEPPLTHADSAGPTISDVSWAPPEPYWDQGINVSANVSDPDGVASVMLQWCIGQMCYPPVPMNRGEGDHYFVFVSREFPNTTVTFDILAQDSVGNPSTFQFNVTFRPRPSSLEITAEAVPSTLYPGENLTVRGRATLNTGEPPTEANITVYLSGDEVGRAETDPYGGFNVTLEAPQNTGNYSYRVVAEGDGFQAETTVDIRVIERPLPDLVLSLMFEGRSRKEGGIFLFEEDPFEGSIEVENTGLAPADNITVTVLRDGEEVLNSSYGFTLSPGERWGLNFTFRAGDVGNHTVYATVGTEGDEITLENNHASMDYTVLTPPSAPEGRVLVELFTSTTCEPCLSAEHALDYLRYLRGENVTVVAYVIDDPNAPYVDVTSIYGVTGTPTVVFDGGYRVKVGGGVEEDLLQNYQRYVNESLMRYREPSEVRITSVNVTGDLLESMKIEVQTGNTTLHNAFVTLYGVTPYLGPGGFDGVPIRYTISEYYMISIPDLGPEESYSTQLYPSWYFKEDGMVVVAALRDSSGEVLSHDRYYEQVKRPPFYVKAPSRVDVPPTASRVATVNLESFFYFWEEIPLPITVNVEAERAFGVDYSVEAPDVVTVGPEDLFREEWGGRLKRYSTSFNITVSAGSDPSEKGAIELTLYTTSLGGWSFNVTVGVFRGVAEVVLNESQVMRREDYVVITASFNNMSDVYLVQVEYIFYSGGSESPSSFASMVRAPNGTYSAEIFPGEDYQRLKYRIYVRDRGKVIYSTDWIDVKVPPGPGVGGGEGKEIWYVLSAVAVAVILLGTYIYAVRIRKKTGAVEE